MCMYYLIHQRKTDKWAHQSLDLCFTRCCFTIYVCIVWSTNKHTNPVSIYNPVFSKFCHQKSSTCPRMYTRWPCYFSVGIVGPEAVSTVLTTVLIGWILEYMSSGYPKRFGLFVIVYCIIRMVAAFAFGYLFAMLYLYARRRKDFQCHWLLSVACGCAVVVGDIVHFRVVAAMHSFISRTSRCSIQPLKHACCMRPEQFEKNCFFSLIRNIWILSSTTRCSWMACDTIKLQSSFTIRCFSIFRHPNHRAYVSGSTHGATSSQAVHHGHHYAHQY